MIMMLILVLGVAAVLVRELSARTGTAARIDANAAALAQAREALLGYASTYDASHPGRFGLLPCPDLDAAGSFAEGEAHDSACLARYRSVIGRFPWKSVGVNPARGETDECLWYAVSGTWKAASAALPELHNPDSNGQFRVYAGDGSTRVAGERPAERAVAVIIAPGSALAGQLRTTLGAGVEHCAGSYSAARYLDADGASGIDNSDLAAAADAIDDFIGADPGREDVNDQLIYITRAELEERLLRRADLQAKLRSLTEAAAQCVAQFGRSNAGGPGDRRLPWPAPVSLASYRADNRYDDSAVGWLSGRLPDRVDDSSAQTGNPLTQLLTNCSPVAVPAWTPELLALWRNWKDHLFYAVAGSFRPDALPHSSCGDCLSVNGAGSWAAVVMFAGPRLDALDQVRDEPPADTDTRGVIGNYLEGRNAANHPDTGGNADYESGAPGPSFNDVLFCIDVNLGVAPC